MLVQERAGHKESNPRSDFSGADVTEVADVAKVPADADGAVVEDVTVDEIVAADVDGTV